jgi:hypothetical protein
MRSRAIICQINTIGDHVADECLSAAEMRKILDALEDAHFQIDNARDRLETARQGEAS